MVTIIILMVLAVVAGILLALCSPKMKDKTARLMSYVGLAVWIGLAIAGGIVFVPETWEPVTRALAIVGASVAIFGIMYAIYLLVMFLSVGRLLMDAILRLFMD